jgi:hypothetical protein
MTDIDRINLLEKKVKNLQTINYLRFGFLVLSLLGVTAYVMNELKKKK